MYDRHYDYSPYVYVLNNPLANIDLYGLTDWPTVLKGTATFAAGLGSTIGGVAAASTPTVVGQIGGTILISTGVPAMGCGIGIIVDGFVNDGQTNLPGGLLEATGMTVDKAVGDGSNTFQNIGAVGDIATNFAAGVPGTAVEKAAIGVLTIDAANNTLGSDKNTTQTNSTDKTIEVNDNTKVVNNTPVDNVDLNNAKIDEQYMKEFFEKK